MISISWFLSTYSPFKDALKPSLPFLRNFPIIEILYVVALLSHSESPDNQHRLFLIQRPRQTIFFTLSYFIMVLSRFHRTFIGPILDNIRPFTVLSSLLFPSNHHLQHLLSFIYATFFKLHLIFCDDKVTKLTISLSMNHLNLNKLCHFVIIFFRLPHYYIS